MAVVVRTEGDGVMAGTEQLTHIDAGRQPKARTREVRSTDRKTRWWKGLEERGEKSGPVD